MLLMILETLRDLYPIFRKENFSHDLTVNILVSPHLNLFIQIYTCGVFLLFLPFMFTKSLWKG